jgi:glycosyltransferase involved in cell wall biosynthesis
MRLTPRAWRTETRILPDSTRDSGRASPRAPLRVAWLAPYDLSHLADRLPSPLQGRFHNSPWITNGARAMAEGGAIDLHVVTHDRRIASDLTFVKGGITFHLIRTPLAVVPRAAVLYQLDLGPFLRTLNEIRPDLVHGHGTENIFSYAAVRSRYPHVLSIQAIIAELVRTHPSFSREWFQHSLVRLVERYTLRRARWVVIKAPFVESRLRSVNPGVTVRLVENIVSTPFFAVKRCPGTTRKKIVFVGRLTPTKGVEEMVGAFHQVAGSDLAIELHLVGQGDPAYVDGPLRALIDAGPAPRRVFLRGRLTPDEIAGEFADAAMVVLPSYYDTRPNAIAEAMVAGVPVIATSVGGLPYMLEDGAYGQLVPPGDVDQLAAAIRRNLRTPDLAAERAFRAQSLARRRYCKERFVTRILRIYERVVANPLGDGSRADDLDADGE